MINFFSNKTLFFTIFFSILIIGELFSDPLPIKCEINGVVKDSLSNEGIPFAAVQLFYENDSVLLKGVLTDLNGNYLLDKIVPGKYKLVVSFMGYNQKEKLVDIQAEKESCDFFLQQKNYSLSEVEITANRDIFEKNIEKTTVNITKNKTLTGGTAIDVLQTLPSVDIDIDGNINYRGSDKVIILVNGEKSEIVKSLDQISANQIEKVELINNPSAKYEAEGMSGIINIVLKSGNRKENKTTVMLNGGYPETFGGNIGYSKFSDKITFFANGSFNHKTKFQTKEHLRENYENPIGLNFYQFDREDKNLNSAFLNTNIEYLISKKQRVGLSVIGSKNFNSATRKIDYETLSKTGNIELESLKDIDIDLDNYTVDGNLNYRYVFKKSKQFLKANLHYSLFDQMQQMNNQFYEELTTVQPSLQNTYSSQLNKKLDFSLDYSHPINDSILLGFGGDFTSNDYLNDFDADNYNYTSQEWVEDTALVNNYNFIQQISSLYFDANIKTKFIEIQAGLRAEQTNNSQNNKNKHEYFDLFPSLNLSHELNNHFTFFGGYNRRINRPTIKMLNPFTAEYADVLNMHRGNPNLKPEYVNSYEVGSRFLFKKFSGFGSFYLRDINHAISRVKSASNDSALFVTYLNLQKAKLLGGEVAISYKPNKWWSINLGANVFYTSLKGEYGNNKVDNSKVGWNANILNKFKLPKSFAFQVFGYYRSKLPSVMGTYIERYYVDMAISKKILKNKGELVFKVSDVFNTYLFGLDLDALDANNFRYSQTNRRKNESQYFILSFIYNINGKEKKKKKQKTNFFLDGFDK